MPSYRGRRPEGVASLEGGELTELPSNKDCRVERTANLNGADSQELPAVKVPKRGSYLLTRSAESKESPAWGAANDRSCLLERWRVGGVASLPRMPHCRSYLLEGSALERAAYLMRAQLEGVANFKSAQLGRVVL